MAHHFEKVSLFTGQNSHTRLVLQNTVMRNMEICDLNSHTHDIIIILYKLIEFLHFAKELTKVNFFIRKV